MTCTVPSSHDDASASTDAKTFVGGDGLSAWETTTPDGRDCELLPRADTALTVNATVTPKGIVSKAAVVLSVPVVVSTAMGSPTALLFTIT